MYKVFLADDEIIVREGIRNSIPWDDTPFTLEGEAPDGEMALSMIHDIKPDILITDIRMPFMDGLALSGIVKETFPWIKIIILSGHDEFEYARQAISIGVDEYLLKPVSVRDMLMTLEKLAKRIDLENEDSAGKAGMKAKTAADNALAPDDGKMIDPAELAGIDKDILLTKIRYASKKDIDSILSEYTAMMGNNWGENTMLIYFLFGEIIVAVSKIAESLGGNVNDIIPFSMDRKTIQEIISSPETFYEKVRALLSALIEYRDTNTKGRYRSVIVKAKEYINNNFNSTDISLFSTAAHVGISPNHLSAVFAQETGENFIDYLTRMRIDRAKLLMKTTSMKSFNIAAETGFGDPHYFSYIFKKHTGLSPRQFRHREQGSGINYQLSGNREQ